MRRCVISRLGSEDAPVGRIGWGRADRRFGVGAAACGGGVAVARIGWVGEFRDELVENRDELVVWRDETVDRMV